MLTRDFDYHLPEGSIAQEPAPRGTSRLLVLDAQGEARHRRVGDLPELLREGDLLVLNDTRVLAARLFGHRLLEVAPETGAPLPPGRELPGAKVELLLIERAEEGGGDDGDGDEVEGEVWEVLARPGKKAKVGSRIAFELPGAGSGLLIAQVLAKGPDGRHRVRFSEPVEPHLDAIGHLPLPPYIKRPDTPEDRERYQTVFARRTGAIAAPTAGLHFTPELLQELEARGIRQARVTLHVGIGTFKPVTADLVHEHVMDEERWEVPEETAQAIAETRERGGRVVAVGTTVVRTLESAAALQEEREGEQEASDQGPGRVTAGSGRTGLFITPGYRFRAVDALLTNFHLPRSTLLMLVSAFAGRERVLAAYEEAIGEGYRFYSYGDAMLLERRSEG